MCWDDATCCGIPDSTLGKCRGSLRLSALVVTPTGASVNAGATQQYTVTGIQCDGSATTVSVTWSCTGGTIDSSGLFTAGSTGGVFSVTAKTTVKPRLTASVSVTVVAAAATLVSIAVSPSTDTLLEGRQQQFTALNTLSDGTTASFGGTWGTDDPSGSVSSSGLYTAGTTPGNYAVTATQSAISGSAAVTVNPLPTLVGITVSPSTANLVPGATQQFTATGKMSDGTTVSVTVTWTATGGTISSTGLFTAGTTAGSYTVTATNGSIQGTASVSVQVTAPAAPTAVIKSPVQGFSVTPGTAVTLDPTGSFSVGSNNPWYAIWTVTNAAGTAVFSFNGSGTDKTTAAQIQTWTPTATGNYAVQLAVVDSFGTQSAPKTVSGSVVASSPTLQSLSVSPPSASLIAGQQQQFTATGTNTDGSGVTNPSVSWTCTGGTITNGGLFTAGSAAGSFAVKATSTQNTAINATASIAISNPLVSISVSPSNPTLNTGAQQQFTATGHYTDGSTGSVVVSWTATAGTINSTGLFTAPSTTGSVTVRATNGSIVGSTTVTVAASTSTLFPNMPSTFIVPSGFERDFNATTEGAWVVNSGSAFFVRDASTYNPSGATAPRNPPASPQNIGEMQYSTSLTQGNAPGTTFIQGGSMSAQAWTKLYFGAFIQPSSNFQSHPSGINKQIIIDIGGNPVFVLSLANGTTWQVRLQDLPSTINGGHSAADFNGGAAQKGLWQLVEGLLVANTPGVANGTLQLWQTNYDSNGNKVSGPTQTISLTSTSFDAGISAGAIGWVGSGVSNQWGAVLWQPVWGGNTTGATVTSTFYVWMDKLRIAGHA